MVSDELSQCLPPVQLREDPSGWDKCRCGDDRREHLGIDGPCLICRNSLWSEHICRGFVLASAVTDADAPWLREEMPHG